MSDPPPPAAAAPGAGGGPDAGPVRSPLAGLRLRRLTLGGFRSYAAATFRFDAPVVLVTGPNGVGKTNLLEAVSLLVPGRGLRGARVPELARRAPGAPADAAPVPWAVAGRFEGPDGPVEVGTGTPPDGPADRRVFRLDGQPLRAQGALADRVAAVWLTPQMDRLFQEAAGGRRRFLDRLAYALEPGHAREVAAHDNAMAQRNRLLAAGGADPAWLAALEDAMARHGVAAAAARRALALRLNATLAAGAVTGDFPAARLELLDPLAAALDGRPALAVEDGLRAALRAGRGRDARAGAALEGAHRADLGLRHLPKDLPAALCSTGEQKALLVSVVLAHAALIAEARGFAPLLLLDEAAAHLDADRRAALAAALARLPAQAFLTGTDASAFAPLRGLAEGFRAVPGDLEPDPAFRAAA